MCCTRSLYNKLVIVGKLKKLDCDGELMEYLPVLLMQSLCFVWPTADTNEIELQRNSQKHHGKHLWIPSFGDSVLTRRSWVTYVHIGTVTQYHYLCLFTPVQVIARPRVLPAPVRMHTGGQFRWTDCTPIYQEYVFLRKCVCIIAAALAALFLSPEIRVHPQQNLSFETNILQSLMEWIVVPSTSAEDSLMEGI